MYKKQTRFRDIEWLKKRDRELKEARRFFQEYLRISKKCENFIISRQHKKINLSIGPEWYQELSNQQLKHIEFLKEVIQEDIDNNNSIKKTKTLLNKIGIFVENKPNESIKNALEKCIDCPIRFLLNLYNSQNIDYRKKKKQYNLFDRLVLSAIVHLTMYHTLYEMHIRIATLTKERMIPKQQTKRISKEHYKMSNKSPFLQKNTYYPEFKNTKNAQITIDKKQEYPSCEYFSYIYELLSLNKIPLKQHSEKFESITTASIFGCDSIEKMKPSHNVNETKFTVCNNGATKSTTLRLNTVSNSNNNIMNIESENSNKSHKIRKFFKKPNDSIFIKCVPSLYQSQYNFISLADNDEKSSTKKPAANNSHQNKLHADVENCSDSRNIFFGDNKSFTIEPINSLMPNATIAQQSMKALQLISENNEEKTIIKDNILNYNVEIEFDDNRTLEVSKSKLITTIENKQISNKNKTENLKNSDVGNCNLLSAENDTDDEDEDEDDIISERLMNRRITLNELPVQISAQLSLIKKILLSMAEDGFPLAQLPNAYQLPQFRLWLKFRNGLLISKRNKSHMLNMNVNFYNHCKHCNINEKHIQKQLRKKISVINSKSITKLKTLTCQRMVQGEMKRAYEGSYQEFRIKQAREFWATMIAYHLSCKRIRDTFFAYMPSQFDNNYVYRPWKKHEFVPAYDPVRRR